MLGGGQLGRMFGIEARKLGYGFHVFDPEPNCPAGQLADVEVNAPFTDAEALREFAQGVDVISYEFENVPITAAEVCSEFAPVRPRGEVLHVCQNREREKMFLRASDIPCAPFYVIDSAESLADALPKLNGAGVLKTADFGYDGKGQMRVHSGDDAAQVWAQFGADRAVLEGWVEFSHEISVVCARGLNGEVRSFPVVENRHRNHILDLSIIPAAVPEPAREEAMRLAQRIVEALDVVGLLTTEFFYTRDGRVLVNELAPRPHNSGHFSFDACVTSQFEQQLRAVCGLPLGSTELLRPVVMLNLLGDLWQDGQPDWAGVLSEGDVKLHLYGKREPRPGRKMGHLCVYGATTGEAEARAEAIRKRLTTGR